MMADIGAGAPLNTNEFAAALGITRQTVRNRLRAGTCPVAPIEGSKPPRWRRTDVERYLTGADV